MANTEIKIKMSVSNPEGSSNQIASKVRGGPDEPRLSSQRPQGGGEKSSAKAHQQARRNQNHKGQSQRGDGGGGVGQTDTKRRPPKQQAKKQQAAAAPPVIGKNLPNQEHYHTLNHIRFVSSYFQALSECFDIPLAHQPFQARAQIPSGGGLERNRKCIKEGLKGLSSCAERDLQNLSKKALIRLDPEFKRSCCRVCQSLLLPGLNLRVRNKPFGPHKRVIDLFCETCRSKRRLPAPPRIDLGDQIRSCNFGQQKLGESGPLVREASLDNGASPLKGEKEGGEEVSLGVRERREGEEGEEEEKKQDQERGSGRKRIRMEPLMDGTDDTSAEKVEVNNETRKRMTSQRTRRRLERERKESRVAMRSIERPCKELQTVDDGSGVKMLGEAGEENNKGKKEERKKKKRQRKKERTKMALEATERPGKRMHEEKAPKKKILHLPLYAERMQGEGWEEPISKIRERLLEEYKLWWSISKREGEDDDLGIDSMNGRQDHRRPDQGSNPPGQEVKQAEDRQEEEGREEEKGEEEQEGGRSLFEKALFNLDLLQQACRFRGDHVMVEGLGRG
ncbi:hypothetical protein IE53DRAFT_381636 [Violaceomyces palustris]|uniref:Uncharacterized protein n=1 Tax=Violaceomyces palustris TaxID=1673888 RepID=A0ACD0NQH4_9BASI|nr:hypothetical protein IE53DRAFT_381636 [Violaceomyces palustris]